MIIRQKCEVVPMGGSLTGQHSLVDMGGLLYWLQSFIQALESSGPVKRRWVPPRRENEPEEAYEARKEEKTQEVEEHWNQRAKLVRKRTPFSRDAINGDGSPKFDRDGNRIREPIYSCRLVIDDLSYYEQAVKLIGIRPDMMQHWNHAEGQKVIARLLQGFDKGNRKNLADPDKPARQKRIRRELANLRARQETEELRAIRNNHAMQQLAGMIFS